MADDAQQHARDVIEDLVRRARDDAGASEPLVVTNFLVIAAATGWNAQGEEVTSVVLIPDGASHTMLGLIGEADVRFRAQILDDYSGGGRD